jgi:uncharacterized protein YbjT (DUF2867 family)
MTKPKILITAAAGNTGFPTALQLLERGFPVRVLVRRETARSRVLQSAGAEVALGDMTDPIAVRIAMTGIQRAYFCPPWSPNMLLAGVTFSLAAYAARLESVVMLGQWLSSPDHPSFATRQTWLLDQLMPLMPGITVTIVNPGWFADNYMQLLETIAQLGVMPLPLGQGHNAPPSNEDIARVICGALMDPQKHAGKTYRPTGPKLLSPEEIAAIFSSVLRSPVRYLDIPNWMMLKALRAMGLPDFQQAQVRYYVQDYRSNAFGIGAPTNVVSEVGGCEAEDFETITRRYVGERPEAQRSASNWIRALVNFLRITLTPALNFERLLHIQEQPSPKSVHFAMDSLGWLATHGRQETRSKATGSIIDIARQEVRP